MPYEQKNNPFRKLVSDIGSALGKLNIKSPDRSSPTSQQAYQQAQRKRFGHQKESKFQYDVRMRKAAKKSTVETKAPEWKGKGTEVDWYNFLGNEPTTKRPIDLSTAYASSKCEISSYN